MIRKRHALHSHKMTTCRKKGLPRDLCSGNQVTSACRYWFATEERILTGSYLGTHSGPVQREVARPRPISGHYRPTKQRVRQTPRSCMDRNTEWLLGK